MHRVTPHLAAAAEAVPGAVDRGAVGPGAADRGAAVPDMVVPVAAAAAVLAAVPRPQRRRHRAEVRPIMRGDDAGAAAGGVAVPGEALHKLGDAIHGRKLPRMLRRQPRIRQAHGAQPSDAEILGGLEHIQ